MKNKNTWLCLLNCSIVLSFITALGTVSILYQKPTFSEIERRDLKEFPTFSKKNYFDGSFAESISAYLADVFPMRENFVRLAGNLTELRGIGYEDVRIHNVAINESEIIDSNTSEDNSSDVISSNSEETNLENAEAVNENKENTAEEQAIRNGAVYVYKGKAFSIYGGSSSMGEYYANCINAYQERLGEKVKIYNMLIPSSIEFGMPEKYRNMSASQIDSINNI